MRIVSWNINMGAHRKVERLLELRPDVAVLPECAHPDVLRKKAPDLPEISACWQGRWEHKGLAVLGFRGVKLRIDDAFDPRFEMFLPVHASGPVNVRLLAVWAFNHRSRAFPRRSQHATRLAMEHYAPFLREGLALAVGDFNNNVVWDGRYPPFRAVLRILDGVGLASVYHSLRTKSHGKESSPTHYFRHGSEMTYHIDYMFAPSRHLDRITHFEVGAYRDWGKLSDHVPLILDLPAPLDRADRVPGGSAAAPKP